MKAIICRSGRCSTWGKSWARHYYEGGETCLRCGMDREEQFNDDKSAGLATGFYKKNTGKVRIERPITSKQIMYCAVGGYGIEYSHQTLSNVKKWIREQREDSDLPEDYFEIDTHTKQELALMPEV